MSNIKVIIKNKNMLELLEDGKKGDTIDLRELEEIDTSFIELLIDSGKDKVYQTRLNEYREKIQAELAIKVADLNAEIKQLKQEKKTAVEKKEFEIKSLYDVQINELKSQIQSIEKEKELDKQIAEKEREIVIEKQKSEDKIEYNKLQEKYNSLEKEIENKINKALLEKENEKITEINNLKSKYELLEKTSKTELEKKLLQKDLIKEKEINDLIDKYNAELNEKNEQISLLQRQKASLNVKQTGEDLEAWCDNEVNSYMQNGLFNCKWYKDNKIVKKDSEAKGSKADFIFNIYADEKHNEDELLTSVCLEMKDENPDSKVKQTNEHYFKKLDENRNKKKCKYAVLVSNLETDKPNIIPIYKVREYEDMYVVRPGYLMVFLNMITSLTTKYANLILSNEQNVLELKYREDLIEEFNQLKETYLENPLESLAKQIELIQKSTEGIRKNANDIDTTCGKIISNYINKIQSKLETFELKNRRQVVKKLDGKTLL